jgi:hypothetical protein
MGKASKQKKLKKAFLPVAKQADRFFINPEGAVAEDFRLADIKYFEQHPEASVYVRPPFPGEFLEARQPKKVEVRQIDKGLRTRIPIW